MSQARNPATSVSREALEFERRMSDRMPQLLGELLGLPSSQVDGPLQLRQWRGLFDAVYATQDRLYLCEFKFMKRLGRKLLAQVLSLRSRLVQRADDLIPELVGAPVPWEVVLVVPKLSRASQETVRRLGLSWVDESGNGWIRPAGEGPPLPPSMARVEARKTDRRVEERNRRIAECLLQLDVAPTQAQLAERLANARPPLSQASVSRAVQDLRSRGLVTYSKARPIRIVEGRGRRELQMIAEGSRAGVDRSWRRWPDSRRADLLAADQLLSYASRLLMIIGESSSGRAAALEAVNRPLGQAVHELSKLLASGEGPKGTASLDQELLQLEIRLHAAELDARSERGG